MLTFATQLRNKPTQSKRPDGGIGRRVGLKHQWIHFHPGSIPGLGTKEKAKQLIVQCLAFLFVSEMFPDCSQSSLCIFLSKMGHLLHAIYNL